MTEYFQILLLVNCYFPIKSETDSWFHKLRQMYMVIPLYGRNGLNVWIALNWPNRVIKVDAKQTPKYRWTIKKESANHHEVNHSDLSNVTYLNLQFARLDVRPTTCSATSASSTHCLERTLAWCVTNLQKTYPKKNHSHSGKR